MGGVARRATVIKEIESQKENVIILDAGSALSGHYDTEYSKGEITIEFMNLLGYDVMTIGTLDLKYKIDELLELNNLAKFRILSANLVSKQDKKTVFKPYEILKKSKRNIAIIGISPFPLVEEKIEKDIAKKYETTNPIRVIEKIIDEIKYKANIVIVLSSAGREIDEEIAENIDKVDIVIGAFSNQPTIEEPILIEREDGSRALKVENYILGKRLGKLIVNFNSIGEIKEFEGELLNLDPAVEDDEEIANILQEYLEEIKKGR